MVNIWLRFTSTPLLDRPKSCSQRGWSVDAVSRINQCASFNSTLGFLFLPSIRFRQIALEPTSVFVVLLPEWDSSDIILLGHGRSLVSDVCRVQHGRQGLAHPLTYRSHSSDFVYVEFSLSLLTNIVLLLLFAERSDMWSSLPISYLNLNLNRPITNQPVLMKVDEVISLFKEVGIIHIQTE